jgi:hypothetical protein
VVPDAKVTLTENDTGLVLQSVANKGGVYVFTPVKIGNYTVTAPAPGFSTASLPGLVLNLNRRLSADVKLEAGNVAQTVTVNSGVAQLSETQQSSTGQVISSQVINDTPLNGRNYVFIAQLTAGVKQSNGSRGEGKGDFNANGQRAVRLHHLFGPPGQSRSGRFVVIEVGRHSQVLWVNELRVFFGGFRFEGDVQSGQTP